MRGFRILLWLLLLGGLSLGAQEVTTASGMVRDSATGEPLSFVSVVFEGTTVGTMTDESGRFALQNGQGVRRLLVSSLGYESKRLRLHAGRNEGLDVWLRPESFELSEVVVRPQRERYSRKNNPAVELAREVIRHKEGNRIESRAEYQAERYEKLSLSLDNFRPNLDRNKFMRKLKFIRNYMDTSEFTGQPILTVSVRETLSDIYYRKSPRTQKTLIKAQQLQGIDKSIDEGGMTSNLEEIFRGVNIFENDINILLNRFVSPLSSTMGIAYYHYYIMDTLWMGGDRCVELAFVPANRQSYGFTGRLYVTLDGRYAVKKVTLNTPQSINLNFINNLRIEQEFKRMPDSAWVLEKENTFLTFSFMSGTQSIHAHQLRTYDKYNYDVSQGDSIFHLLGATHIVPGATERTDSFWVASRHVPLKEKENVLNELVNELRKIPAIHVIIKTAEILISGYIPTHTNKDANCFDFGPMNTVFSANWLEGFRMRVGGMTTANLHPQLFATGYVAYGMSDRKWKYNARLTYSFDKKKYHEGEPPVNNLSLLQEYDVYTPGQTYLHTSKDNMFVALKTGEPVTKMTYVQKSALQYEKEWLNGLTAKVWTAHRKETPAGTLQYLAQEGEGQVVERGSLTSSELGVGLRFAPGERAYSGRQGKNSVFNLSKDAPVFQLSHCWGIKGLLGSNYGYQHTEASAQKRIWLSSFGHIDARLAAGTVWNKAPFPFLVLPNANQSITIQPEAFHLMRALEFVTDRYVSFEATYYLKGWLLNRVPLIRWLKFREVISFNGIYGPLSDKNNPTLSSDKLFLLPEGTMPLGQTPYMEASVGIENIFKIFRIDYFRRLTYLDNPKTRKGGFRIALRFTF